MINIGVIVPKELKNIVVQAAEELNEKVTVIERPLNCGFELARKLEKKGYDVIIARGGTELLLKKAVLQIPIVVLPITPMDIFKAMRDAYKYESKVAVITFNNVLPAIESYEEIIEVQLEKYLVKEEEDIERSVIELHNKGYKVVVGGGVVANIAAQYGIRPVVISTGKEVFANAIREAKNIVQATIIEKEKGERFKAIVEHTYNGIVAVDEKGFINTFNFSSEKLLNIKRKDIIGKPINYVIPQLELGQVLDKGIKEIDVIKNIGDSKLMVSNVPIYVRNEIFGAVSVFHDVKRIQQMEEKIRREALQSGHYAKYSFKDVIGEGESTKEQIRLGKEYAKVNSTVLIEGETGTGKEIMAQSIHSESERALRPFVAVNCAALPESLLESELFGYASGAFTGADRKGRAGLFELAHNGTIFLDEISEMNLGLQGRLLRVLQEKQIMRVGADKLTPINVRVIVATNNNLYEMVKAGKFREDLYYRLNVLKVKLVPLRYRQEDIPCFIKSFTDQYCERLRKDKISFTEASMGYLCKYTWPGNVRQLRNFVERAVVMAKTSVIDLRELENTVLNDEMIEELFSKSNNYEIINSFEINEKEEIIAALKKSYGNVSKAAKFLDISRTTLWRKMKKFNILVTE
ncbi:sigma 54-interacting transcriptional regulator [Clostridium sp.]|uniref:sigma 54-interacting transcriptional regulator n=1 Tax=Clostridium sp. TaxID=1506 RepID=UPI002FC696B7